MLVCIKVGSRPMFFSANDCKSSCQLLTVSKGLYNSQCLKPTNPGEGKLILQYLSYIGLLINLFIFPVLVTQVSPMLDRHFVYIFHIVFNYW